MLQLGLKGAIPATSDLCNLAFINDFCDQRIPVTKQKQGEASRLLSLEEQFQQRAVDRRLIKEVVKADSRCYKWLSSPYILFLGSPGVDKTELVKADAREI